MINDKLSDQTIEVHAINSREVRVKDYPLNYISSGIQEQTNYTHLDLIIRKWTLQFSIQSHLVL
jgi:hypothetical protein